MNNIKGIILLLFAFISLLSCERNSGKKSEETLKKEQREKEFNTQMESLLKRYPKMYDSSFFPDSLSYYDSYKLGERQYYPFLRNLTFEVRHKPYGSNWSYTFIHVYNDSFSCVIPLTDELVYEQISRKGADTSTLGLLNFSTELNNIITKFRLNTIEEKRGMVECISGTLNWRRLDYYDICRLKELAATFSKNSNYTDVCKRQLISSLKIVESQINNQNLDIFSNGLLIYIFSYSQGKESVKMEVLNSNCSYSYP